MVKGNNSHEVGIHITHSVLLDGYIYGSDGIVEDPRSKLTCLNIKNLIRYYGIYSSRSRCKTRKDSSLDKFGWGARSEEKPKKNPEEIQKILNHLRKNKFPPFDNKTQPEAS